MIDNTTQASAGKRLVVIHGGPRPGGNTAALLEQAEEGAREAGAVTERVNLLDIEFRGCKSCFACKLRGGKSYGQCAQRDGLTPTLTGLSRADALLIGSPIYIGSVTSASRAFLERLLFPWFTYTGPAQSLFPKSLAVGTVYTFGAPSDLAAEAGFEQPLRLMESMLGLVFRTQVQSVSSYDTLQFDDYAKYVADRFDPVHKAARHREVFPLDCQRARDLGRRLMS
jgi:multimeric flavodoxin WrbA